MLKRYLLIAAIASLWPLSAFAQTTIGPLPVSGNLASGAATLAGQPQTYPSFTIQLSGTWTGTVTFEVRTQESLSYVSVLGTSVTDGSTSTTATSNGAWVIFNGGYSSVRANFSTATSGTVITAITPGYAQAKLASPQFSNPVANTWCMSATTKDSYWQEVAANDPGLFTGGTACAGGTVRLDLTSTRALFAVNAQLGAANTLNWTGQTIVSSPANGQLNITNAAASAGVGFNVTSDGVLAVRVRAQNAYGDYDAANYRLGSNLLCSSNAPARSSGFGTNADASFATGSNACSWDMNIGTGGAPTSGVLTMPTASHGWMCQVRDITTPADNTYQSAYTTGTVTLTTTIAWSANDHIFGTCLAF